MGRNPATGEAIKISSQESGEISGCEFRQGRYCPAEEEVVVEALSILRQFTTTLDEAHMMLAILCPDPK
jgi:hypothetical protein